MEQIAAIILAAGQGTRMKSVLPKVMHPLAGRPMIAHLLQTVEGLSPDRIAVVVGPGMEGVARAVAPHRTALQSDRLGTAHAVLTAEPLLAGFEGIVLVLYGDTPLISGATLQALLAEARRPPRAGVVVLGFRPEDPGAYGRLIEGADGLAAIVEARDATPDQLAVGLCNSGVMAIDGRKLFGWLKRIGNANAKGEYYLTDLVALAVADGARCSFVEGAADELLGVNSRVELAAAEALLQNRLRLAAMEGGATLTDPSSVTFAYDTRLGTDVIVGPHVFFGPGVTVADRVEIRPFCHIEGAVIGQGAIVGPFARLRPGAVIGRGVHVGNFVEIKNARLEEGAKVNHLSYVGDARVGAGANVGAGTITCNYDGYDKFHTDIGAGAFIGSNSALVAPVSIGDGAPIGAGAGVTQDVAPDSLAVVRAGQRELAGWALRLKERKLKDKKE